MKKKNDIHDIFHYIFKTSMSDKLLIVAVYCGNCATYSQKLLWQCLMELH